MTATGIWIGEVELSESLVPSGVGREQQPDDSRARVLVRSHGQFIGFVTVPLNGKALTAHTVEAAVHAQLAGPLGRHLEGDESHTCPQASMVGGEELISVIVPTRNRPVVLAACLERIQQIRYSSFEVLVVDNASTDASTKECFDRIVGNDARFRCVVEPMPGVSKARNRGVSEANGRYVAFTDDDVLVDEWWLDRIAAGFARDPDAGCVTGLVPSSQIDDPAQAYFDRRYSWASGTQARVFDLGERRDPSPLYPYEVGIFGTGANCAVERDLLEQLGGFDESLGAGTLAYGGEDLDLFIRVLRAGRSIVYDPSAIVWHTHRSDARALRRQLFSYGAGLTAFATKYVADPSTRGEILSRLRAGVRHLRLKWKQARTSGRTPRFLVVTEALGMVFGPVAYFRSRRLLRRSSAYVS